MKVIRARVLGFCMGVRRAVNLACGEAESSAARKPGVKVYTLGPLIHNPRALEDLRRRGVEILKEESLPQDLRDVSVIIRAHGVNPVVEDELRKRGAVIVDATCPRVKASQLKAAALAGAGYRLFLAGEAHHAEIAGIRGYVAQCAMAQHAEDCLVVGNAAEAEKAAAELYAEHSDAKTALIGQTTISAEEYQAIGSAILKFFPGLEIAQTICPATRERQDSLRELFDAVSAVIIVGGRNSANTRRLLTIAKTAGKPCAIVESSGDIPADFFGYETIGLAAGASTPDTVVDAVEWALSE